MKTVELKPIDTETLEQIPQPTSPHKHDPEISKISTIPSEVPDVTESILEDTPPSSPPPLFEEEAIGQSDVYCFESDHVALRQNLE